MKDFLRTTFTREKMNKLLVSTTLGNFAGYIAGSLVTTLSTYHSVERRALRNLFGVIPRKQVLVHILPEWLEWLLALLVGFTVMEFVRYSINREKVGTVSDEVPRQGTPFPTPPPLGHPQDNAGG